MITVIDYNVGNVKSVCNAFRHIGCEAELSRDSRQILGSTGIVLPGVAAFGYAVNALGETAEVLRQAAENGVTILGICVGFQLLFEQSFEHGRHKGLGFIKGDVVGIPAGRVIPHMGWNKVTGIKGMNLFEGFEKERHFYFAHSYYARISDEQCIRAYCEYGGIELPAAIQKKNIYGVQFHPEKSGPAGLKVLENFARLCGKRSGEKC